MRVISQNPVRVETLMERFPNLFSEVLGDTNRVFTGVTTPEAAQSDSAVFLATPKAFKQGLISAAGVLVINKKYRAEAEASCGQKTIIVSNNVERAMAATIHEFFMRTPYTQRAWNGIHPTAVIGEGSEIAPDVRIGPHAVIGANVKIAAGVFVGANSIIEDQSEVGEQTVIHPLVFIGHSTQIGRHCEIHPNATIGKEGYGYAHDERFNHYRIPHQGRVVLEDDVHIGAGTCIDRSTFLETRIAAGTKIDNLCHIAHNLQIGPNSLITAGFIVAGSTKIGANFVAGGSTSVTGHIEICDNVQLGGVSTVTKSIQTPGAYSGHPLLPLQQHLKMKAAMVHLSDMRRQLKAILKKLGMEDLMKSPSEKESAGETE